MLNSIKKKIKIKNINKVAPQIGRGEYSSCSDTVTDLRDVAREWLSAALFSCVLCAFPGSVGLQGGDGAEVVCRGYGAFK